MSMMAESTNPPERRNCGAPRTSIPATLGAVLLVLALSLPGTGCRSTRAGSNAFAAVEIRGNTPGQISAVAEEVFQENGFKAVTAGPNRLVFEKQGSSMSNLAYGNWTGEPVWIRAKTAVVPLGEALFRLECQAYVVRDRGGTTEEEVRVGGLGKGTYQKMLQEVARRLRGEATPSRP